MASLGLDQDAVLEMLNKVATEYSRVRQENRKLRLEITRYQAVSMLQPGPPGRNAAVPQDRPFQDIGRLSSTPSAVAIVNLDTAQDDVLQVRPPPTVGSTIPQLVKERSQANAERHPRRIDRPVSANRFHSRETDRSDHSFSQQSFQTGNTDYSEEDAQAQLSYNLSELERHSYSGMNLDEDCGSRDSEMPGNLLHPTPSARQRTVSATTREKAEKRAATLLPEEPSKADNRDMPPSVHASSTVILQEQINQAAFQAVAHLHAGEEGNRQQEPMRKATLDDNAEVHEVTMSSHTDKGGKGMPSEGDPGRPSSPMTRSKSRIAKVYKQLWQENGQMWPVWRKRSEQEDTLFLSPSLLQVESAPAFTLTDDQIRGGDTLRDKRSCLQPFVISPNSIIRMSWDIMSTVVLFVDIMSIPLVAFGTLENPIFQGMRLFGTFFWCFDMPMNFLSGLHVGGIIDLRPSTIRREYIRGWFVADLVILFFDVTLTIMDSAGDFVGLMRMTKVMRFARILRFIRMVRVFRMPSTFQDVEWSVSSELMITSLKICRSLCTILIANHFICAGWYAVSVYTHEQLGMPSWVQRMDEEGRDVWYRYITSLHWSLTQFTPASMEVFPRNLYERLYALVIVFSALLVFSTFVSSITTSMAEIHRISQERHVRQKEIRQFISHNKISIDLANRIVAFIRMHNFSAGKKVHEADIQVFKVLPEKLRLQLHWEVYLPVISQHPMFWHVSRIDEPGMLSVFHHATSQQYLDTCHELFRQGQEANFIYIVVSGSAEYSLWMEDAQPFEVKEKHWLSEPVLWVKWSHLGRLSAVTPMEIVKLDPTRCRSILLHREKLQAPGRVYAAQYAKALIAMGRTHPLDVWWDHDKALEMAQKAFEKYDIPGSTAPQKQGTNSMGLGWLGFKSWSPSTSHGASSSGHALSFRHETMGGLDSM